MVRWSVPLYNNHCRRMRAKPTICTPNRGELNLRAVLRMERSYGTIQFLVSSKVKNRLNSKHRFKINCQLELVSPDFALKRVFRRNLPKGKLLLQPYQKLPKFHSLSPNWKVHHQSVGLANARLAFGPNQHHHHPAQSILGFSCSY